MIVRYHLLARRLQTELDNLKRVVERAESALARARQQPHDQDYYLAAAALDMHGFYAGLERLFELIASEVDTSRPVGPAWHRELLTQMTLNVPGVRPAVITTETRDSLIEYLEFRHMVRNVYTFNLRPERVAGLVSNLRSAFDLACRDLLAFARFLTELGDADQAQ